MSTIVGMRASTTGLAAWRAAASASVKFVKDFRYVMRDCRVERDLGSMDCILVAGGVK